jgi:diguanylate cyclase (GGDEF)-like protein
MEIRFYLRLLQRGWWLILVSMLLAVNVSLVYSYEFITPMYETEARYILTPDIHNFERGRDLADSLETLDKRSIVATFAEVINSNQIFEESLELFNLNPIDFIGYERSVVVLPEANIIELKVRGPNPEVVAFLANSIGQYAIDFIVELYQVYDISVIDKAVVPTEPSQPRPLQDAILALVVGGAIGGVFAILREQLASSLESLRRRRMTDSESLAYTKSFFERHLRNEISNEANRVLSLGFVYLNGLQEVVDSLPQVYINQILRHVTDTLRNRLRGNDIIGRWSHLQFSILLPTTSSVPATHTLGRIREILENPISLDPSGEMTVDLDPRIGVASYQEGEPFGDLIGRTEQALDLARQSEEKIFFYDGNPKD